jgi:L-ribulose-5-phosphate 3-epimerase
MASDISLAQWALVEEHRAGKIKATDLPRIAREDFGLNGVEWVNSLFEVPHKDYLDEIRHRCEDQGVQSLLIMVDFEGDGCCADKQGRALFPVLHRKWVDIAHYLGCSAIRTNCRGDITQPRADALNWAVESYLPLIDYASPAGIKILIENHGGFSNDADWMVELFQKVNHPLLGSYPDWRGPGFGYDHVEYLRKMLPWAGGMSFRNMPTEAETRTMLDICIAGGFEGWYGIESNGREEVVRGIELLRQGLR